MSETTFMFYDFVSEPTGQVRTWIEYNQLRANPQEVIFCLFKLDFDLDAFKDNDLLAEQIQNVFQYDG
jgi:hypothetical protein